MKDWLWALPEPLTNNGKVVKLPNKKTSLYSLTTAEMKHWYRANCKANYPGHIGAMMSELDDAFADEPEGLDGRRVQLSALMAHYFWWW